MREHPISRRGFLAGASAATVAAALGPEAIAAVTRRPSLRGGRFAEGIMSGDPGPDGITLWTRLADVEGRGTVELEVARDRGFRRVVARKLVPTSAGTAHSVKARVRGLRPHEEYWYRFATRGSDSQVGRFRTALPPDSRQPVRFAFFSCQDYTFGFFNAHALLAEEDVDFVVCLGDYIYADSQYAAGDQAGGVRTDPVGVAETLQQYRAKYALYRSDANLRRMHSRHPLIVIWDDHEVQNAYAGGAGPTGGLPPELRYSQARRTAAYRAFFESLPTYGARRGSQRIYRGMRFGKTMDLVLLDQRQYRGDQPCGDVPVAAPCPELDQPRPFLGDAQMSFVKNRLANTPAAWKVIANQTMVMGTRAPGGQLIGFDSWQGYPRERRELLTHIRRRRIRDVVFVTGDIHTFVAGDVRVDNGDSRPVATEFVGGSITSIGLGEGAGGVLPGANPFNPQTPPAIVDLLRQENPWVRDADFDHHGYGLVTAGPKSFSCTLRRTATIKSRSREALPGRRFTYRLARGEPSLLD
ncbi:MAG TPA: alkaline phosphatase D family protein [Thermoleophilaceae bacterium]|nr:alkaline phosphatase D family protein [Thermoleophilaceae bacterium]